MSFSFNPKQGPILILAEISGPAGPFSLRLALDTGATQSLVQPMSLALAGYDSAAVVGQSRVVTGNGIIAAQRFVLNRLSALGQHRFGFPVLSSKLSAESGVDGVLGLDFFRGSSVTLDFRAGMITIA